MRCSMRLALLVALITGCWSGVGFTDDLPAGVLQTARAMNTNRDLLRGLPVYTCLETISRSHPGRGHSATRHLDVVQVDVGVGENQEIYSWPGQSTFSSRDLFALVGSGLLSTGLFHSFATNLFVSNHGIAVPAGEAIIRGRQTLHFTYKIPSLESRWLINWLGASGRADEEGEFWVDVADYKLVRLRVQANAISPNVPLKALNTTIDYQLQALNGRLTLLPKEAQVIAVESNGTVLQNDAAFSHCHVFEAESTFGSSTEALEKAVNHYEAQRGILPAGLAFRINLVNSIRATLAKVGDPVEARLDGSLKISADVTAPSGSMVSGHIREFAKLEEPVDTYLVGLEFDQLSWSGQSYSFYASSDGIQQLVGFSDRLFHGSSASRNSVAGTMNSATNEMFWVSEIPGIARFFLEKASEVPRGFWMSWRTKKMAGH